MVRNYRYGRNVRSPARWAISVAEISRVVECRSVCNSTVVEVGAGSLVAYGSSERSLLRLNRVLALRTE